MNTKTENHLLLRTAAYGEPDCVVQGQILQNVEGVQGCSGREDLYLTAHGWQLREFFQWNVHFIRISTASTPLIWRAVQTSVDNVECVLSVGPYHRPRPNPTHQISDLTHCQVNLWTQAPTQPYTLHNPTPMQNMWTETIVHFPTCMLCSYIFVCVHAFVRLTNG